MSPHVFSARATFRALTGLDLGLRVHIYPSSKQGMLFSGAEDLSVQELVSELSEMISGLRVYSYALRGQLEQVTSALMRNVEGGSWRYARRAALDLGGLLSQAAKRRQADTELCVRGANTAFRIASLCDRGVR